MFVFTRIFGEAYLNFVCAVYVKNINLFEARTISNVIKYQILMQTKSYFNGLYQ